MNKNNKFKIIMISISVISTFLTVISYIAYKYYNIFSFKTVFITLLTISFHFNVRIIIGNVVPIFKTDINISNEYYKLRKFEKNLYKVLVVKKWKDRLPTYEEDEFDLKTHSLNEIAINIYNAEIIHSINSLLSYIPCLFIFLFGNPIIFIVTSFLASIYDLQFVIVQRYNRARIIKVLNKSNEIRNDSKYF